MKSKIHYKVIFAIAILFAACKEDNYDAPESSFSGRIVYQGEPIGVQHLQVRFELWQPGFGKLAPIDVNVAQDGSWSSLLFDGDYKLVIPPGEGPFAWRQNSQGRPDTMAIALRGSQTLDIEVTPYYMIRNSSITASGNTVTASCGLEQVITDANARDVERVTLYVNKTQFVSGADNIQSVNLAGSAIADLNNINLSVDVPAMTPSQNYVFARIGVKIAGVEDLIFSPLVRVQL